MNAETFLENFGHLADAPGGVKKLREMILQLAVQGKLVEQDPNDEPAERELERIAKARRELVAKGNVRSSKQMPLPDLDEAPFLIPPSWQWTRIGSLMEKMGAGSTPLGGRKVYVDQGVPFLRSQNVWNDGLRLDGVARIPKDIHERMAGTHVHARDVLLNITGASIGRCAVVPDPFASANVSQHVAILRPIERRFSDFLHLCVISRFFQERVMRVQVGVSREGLSMTRLRHFPVPFPPLAEQRRIVAKVDELMSLCDELEARQQERNRVRVRLNEAALDRLTTAGDDDELTAAWTRVRSHFDTLYTVPENVAALRQAILQLAVQGKLVEQDPNDEPASLLLSDVESLRSQLVSQNCMPNYHPQEELDTTRFRCFLPPTWEWAQLGALISLMDSGWSPKCDDHPTTSPQQWGVLKTTAVQPLRYDAMQHKQLPAKLEPRRQHEVQAGDLLITRAGPRQRVGISCVVTETRPRLMISDKIIRFHLLSDALLPDFIVLCLNAGVSQGFLEEQKSGMAASQMNIAQTKLRRTPMPIAPTNEQRRIVERVRQLMSLCDDLEARLAQQQSDADRLTEAMVAEVLEGAAAGVGA
ncbi:Type-1 restriction enzyme EcoKI specificity protein [Maioricimonas rarisocia]|uniref:Type-1 restriction enzyme EcoKI specificity protein n=1 Tax=Maioricimonas rarisocia TaxID=2528026 RepID=A0A517ZB76_9PLAN|nr:restriction endonuclease subunit S [Maioricimonas rarisocia]QDU39717.1 Type-1 restriction enzyme EcoKI specificity protein [Maioricimonas rarisocia]